MDAAPLIYLMLALATSGLIITLCYYQWANTSLNTLPFKISCALLISINFYSWIQFSGAEFGLVYAFLTLGSLSWLLIIKLNAKKQTSNTQSSNGDNPTKIQPQTWPSLPTSAVAILKVFLSAFAAGIACAVIATASIPLMPGSIATQMVCAAFIYIGLWATAIYWLNADPKPWRPPAIIATATGIAFLLTGAAS